MTFREHGDGPCELGASRMISKSVAFSPFKCTVALKSQENLDYPYLAQKPASTYIKYTIYYDLILLNN